MRCKHCGSHIVKYNAYDGPRWTHKNPNASFMDGAHEVCYARTRAEPASPVPHPTTTTTQGDQQ